MVVAHKSSSDEIGILRQLFRKYDSRHDGAIWFDEFCVAMEGLGHSQEELRSTFDALVSRCRSSLCSLLEWKLLTLLDN